MCPRDLAWPRFSLSLRDVLGCYLTLSELIESLIYPRRGCEGPGMAEVVSNP